MGLEAIYPKSRLRQGPPTPRGYPSLLRGGPIIRGQQVWSTAITDIRRQGGFLSWVAVLDGGRRDGLAWAGSSTLDVGLGLAAWDRALAGAQPEIFHRDQGAQCTRLACTGRLASVGIHIRMDGRGRALANVFGERLGRTVKYEEVSGQDYETPREAIQGVGTCFVRDHERRQPQSLAYQTPAAVYSSSSVSQAIFILTLFCLDDGVRFKKTAVILPIEVFEELLEDIEDLAIVAKRREEPTMAHDQLVTELKRDGLI